MTTTGLRGDHHRHSRRRVLRLVAAASGAGFLGALGFLAGRSSTPDASLHRWQGTALGADASLLIDLPDPERAKSLIRMALAEIDRLERIFSRARAESGR